MEGAWFISLSVFILAAQQGVGGNSFMIIANSSLPCSNLTVDQDGQARQYLPSSEEYLQFVFNSKGGMFYRNHMATTRQEADDNFPALLSSDPEVRRTIRAKLQSHGMNSEGPILRSDVIKMLRAERLNRAARLTSESGNERKPLAELPYKLAEDLGLAPSFVTEAGITESGFCLYRGSFLGISELYLRLCTVCNIVLNMGAEVWPSFLNEAACTEDDRGCLYDPEDEDVTHGVCHNIRMSVNILRRTSDQCVLVLLDGRTVVAEEWDLAEETLRTGCECGMDTTSFLADYV